MSKEDHELASIEKNITEWLKGASIEEKKEIESLKISDPIKIQKAFSKQLVFGTGGIRGEVGVGTAFINAKTIKAVTKGLASYIIQYKLPLGVNKSVLIGYDSRIDSRFFAEETAKILAAEGIRAYLFDMLRPVIAVSFGIRYLKCCAGVMITASHNPAIYNGYKVYWTDGGQVVFPHDEGIISAISELKDPFTVKGVESLSHPLITIIGKEIDEAYEESVSGVLFHPDDNSRYGNELKIVYSNLHGAGIEWVPHLLKVFGFDQLSFVEEQKVLDGHFPGLKSPNPEEVQALSLGLKKLQNDRADIFLATDPDCDRIGVSTIHREVPFSFTGNQVACLLTEYICRHLHRRELLGKHTKFVKTIVTTEILQKIVSFYGADLHEVITGFKFIGKKISSWENTEDHFIFGCEESYGYLFGNHGRDKDAVLTAALICEMTLQLKLQGSSLVDFLMEIYSLHGLMKEKTVSIDISAPGKLDRLNILLQELRCCLLQGSMLKGISVICAEDYKTLLRHDFSQGEGKTFPIHDFPVSDVLRLFLENGSKIVIRPSGTEPKLKLYVEFYDESVKNKSSCEVFKAFTAADQEIEKMITRVRAAWQL